MLDVSQFIQQGSRCFHGLVIPGGIFSARKLGRDVRNRLSLAVRSPQIQSQSRVGGRKPPVLLA